ncbi:MAG TPA: DUF5060 domain-containing protein [Verrucomicrobiae bacterium]|nr:DUF5060 domain-containing protein [Verrucomicrobiae bacterium]
MKAASLRVIWFALLLIAANLFATEQTIEQWGMFELALAGPTNGNPFTDVKFAARFTQGNTTVRANGFYDGNGIYRVRFMPETQGEWHYLTESSSPELNGKTGKFTVTKPAPGNHGPVRVAHTYHFAYADGTPYWELGTTCYVWELQSEALQEETLKTLAASPFNKIRFCVFPKHYAWNTNEPAMYPFVGKPLTNWDFTRFNPKYFQHIEQCILDLQKLGIQADIILFHPYDGGHWGFDRMSAGADDRYLRYVVARFAAYRNVWWSLANEWDFMHEKTEADFVRFGEIVSHDDPYHHLLSIHNGAKLFNNTLPFITHASIQNGMAVESPACAELYRDVYRKPVVYDEVKYEGNIPLRWGDLTPQEMVFRFWNATVAGTYCGHGETYLSPDNVLWWSKGGVLKGQSPARLAFLKKILETAPPEGIDPIDKWQNPEYGGQPGKYYLVYLGKQKPKSWLFKIPIFKIPRPPLARIHPPDGEKFRADVLDTWNMTITPVPAVFVLKKLDDYFYGDAMHRSIPLPGRPYLAIRIERVND